MDLGRYGVRDILDCTFEDFVTKKPFLYMDYATGTTNEWTGNSVYARGGRGNPRRICFNDSRDGTLTITTQIFTMKHLAMIAGRDIETGNHKIFKREVALVTDNAGTLEITLEKTPVPINDFGTVGVSDVAVFKYKNGIDTDPVTVSAVDGANKKLTVTGVADREEVVVYYRWETTNPAHKLTFTAKDFPKYVKIYGDTLIQDEISGKTVDAQIVYYKAKVQPNLNLQLNPSGDPTEVSMTFDLFPIEILGEQTMADIILYED